MMRAVILHKLGCVIQCRKPTARSDMREQTRILLGNLSILGTNRFYAGD